MNSHKVSMASTTPEEDVRQLIRTTLNRDGGDPSLLLELLSRVVEMRVWERFGLKFTDFIEKPYDEGGEGWSIADVKTVIKLTHRYEKPGRIDRDIVNRLSAMRLEVSRLIEEEAPPGNPNGTNQYSGEGVIYNTLKQRGTSREYKISRLKAIDPAIADRVISGELSAAAGMRLAGLEKKRNAIDMEDPFSAAATIIKHMHHEQIKLLVDILLEELQRTAQP